ncbi:Transposase zinc-ribbon domain-containing protein [Vreelandella subglaciescola]|uniref:Transposase zinc-ribbon domain-containing protein n=1 Tax=Vreelandella subglaciescola TaxID=29571 RepID=A0A1M7F836_9GAMM|nr:Transposase zinc-ribbon domain-containing protein [Halomonas subglaciescola]
MAMNPIQFQPGLSMPEFFEHYGIETQCAVALEQTRWPNGFRCPRCEGTAYSRVRRRHHTLFQCRACRHHRTIAPQR